MVVVLFTYRVQSYGDCPRNEGAYSVNDKIQVMYGKGKSRRIYEAKVRAILALRI